MLSKTKHPLPVGQNEKGIYYKTLNCYEININPEINTTNAFYFKSSLFYVFLFCI